MTTMIVAVLALAAVNLLYKAAGRAIPGDRPFPPGARAVADALPVTLLAALLVVGLLGHAWRAFDWTVLPGLAVALFLRARRFFPLLCVVAGIACTTAVRLALAGGCC